MKKLFLSILFFSLLGSVTYAKNGGVKLVSGDVSVMKQEAPALIVFDYDGMIVNGMPEDEYIESMGEGFVDEEWNKILPATETFFVNQFNRSSAKVKGLKAVNLETAYLMSPETFGGYDYKVVVDGINIRLGNVGGVFNPFGGADGGSVLSCRISVMDAESGEVKCSFEVTDFAGPASYTASQRWSSCYIEMIKAVFKIVKKSK